MKINLLAAGAFAVALAMPLGVYAQQGPPPASRAYGRPMPSEGQLQQRWARRLGNLNLSADQQQRIQSLIHQYSQAHPQGSAPDRAANRELRRQLMSQLNDDQRNQFHQQMRARRAQMQQRYQGQGPADQQYARPPDQQDQQGPPPDQGAPQGQGPPDQGPPPGQGPPDQAPPSV